MAIVRQTFFIRNQIVELHHFCYETYVHTWCVDTADACVSVHVCLSTFKLSFLINLIGMDLIRRISSKKHHQAFHAVLRFQQKRFQIEKKRLQFKFSPSKMHHDLAIKSTRSAAYTAVQITPPKKPMHARPVIRRYLAKRVTGTRMRKMN